ncbi:MAG: hypothetical protein EBV92_12045, partial [Betaproteobacteria bacterium]|nr:hypothetical protein [Betaproteobacteria bacterium]
ANKIVLGKLSGRNAFKQRLLELGVQLDSETEINAADHQFLSDPLPHIRGRSTSLKRVLIPPIAQLPHRRNQAKTFAKALHTTALMVYRNQQ